MDRLHLQPHHHSGTSESPSKDVESMHPPFNRTSLHLFPSIDLNSDSAASFKWPRMICLNDAHIARELYFENLQKAALRGAAGKASSGRQASTLLELLTIRASHSKYLHINCIGTAIGYRIRQGVMTNIPAILVFVGHKVHRQWLNRAQCLPETLEGPGGVWCDVDVIEFSYIRSRMPNPKECIKNEKTNILTGSDCVIGPGCQVATRKTLGTMGVIVKSRKGCRQVGFLTDRHAAVDLELPIPKLFHPLAPNQGGGAYIGTVHRATSFVPDDVWFGIFLGTNPETYTRSDGAYVPFDCKFSVESVTTAFKFIGEIGDVHAIDLQSSVSTVVGRKVVNVGREGRVSNGTIMAYAPECSDGNGISFVTDLLVVGEDKKAFDPEGNSGSLVFMKEQDGGKPAPVGFIRGGVGNRGILKLKADDPAEIWTSVVDLARALDVLEIDMIKSEEELRAAVRDQMNFASKEMIQPTLLDLNVSVDEDEGTADADSSRIANRVLHPQENLENDDRTCDVLDDVQPETKKLRQSYEEDE